MFVAMLSTLPGAGEPIDFKVAAGTITSSYLDWIDDGYGDGARVNSTPALSWWDALYAVAARLVFKIA